MPRDSVAGGYAIRQRPCRIAPEGAPASVSLKSTPAQSLPAALVSSPPPSSYEGLPSTRFGGLSFFQHRLFAAGKTARGSVAVLRITERKRLAGTRDSARMASCNPDPAARPISMRSPCASGRRPDGSRTGRTRIAGIPAPRFFCVACCGPMLAPVLSPWFSFPSARMDGWARGRTRWPPSIRWCLRCPGHLCCFWSQGIRRGRALHCLHRRSP